MCTWFYIHVITNAGFSCRLCHAAPHNAENHVVFCVYYARALRHRKLLPWIWHFSCRQLKVDRTVFIISSFFNFTFLLLVQWKRRKLAIWDGSSCLPPHDIFL